MPTFKHFRTDVMSYLARTDREGLICMAHDETRARAAMFACAPCGPIHALCGEVVAAARFAHAMAMHTQACDATRV